MLLYIYRFSHIVDPSSNLYFTILADGWLLSPLARQCQFTALGPASAARQQRQLIAFGIIMRLYHRLASMYEVTGN
jgi:hypothetical protein